MNLLRLKVILPVLILTQTTEVFSITGLAHYQLLSNDETSAAVGVLSHQRFRRSVSNVEHVRDRYTLPSDFDLAEKLSKVVFNLSAFGETFNIRVLSMGNAVNQQLLARGFQVYTISESGQRRKSNVNLDRFFNGIVENSVNPDVGQDSEVFGYIDKNRVAMMTIRTRQETFSVEPLFRFTNETDQKSSGSHPQYIVYRASDLRMPNNSVYCKYAGPPVVPLQAELMARSRREASNNSFDDMEDLEMEPVKAYSMGFRSTARDSCELCLVADYKFFTEVAHSDETEATSYMIYLVSQVNNIYRKENFGLGTDKDFLNYGFTIKRIDVHQAATLSTRNPIKRHYNAEQERWEQTKLLEAFSRTGDHASCCLSHLFTHRPFDGGVLGLAYLANPRQGKVGGICSQVSSFYVNTGWSSTMFNDGSLVPSQQSVLVLAHELGHNWGSPHDLETKECAPSSSKGGKYIMWMYSVPGYESNNWHFSPCSLTAIGAVIRAKSRGCFRPRPQALCGNGFVEESEECDGGPAGLRDEDVCCNPDCTFRPKAQCSDVNQVCCKMCRPASADTLCWRDNDLAQPSTCLGRAYCKGTTAECQPRELLSDRPCFDGGWCRNGTCLTFCEVHGHKTCMCDERQSACNYCCFVNETCQPLVLDNGLTKILPDGRPCPFGVCSGGICHKTMMNTVEKIWSYLTEIDVNNLAKFIRDNIVMATIVIAVIVWIPLSCAVWCLDRRQERILDEQAKRWERYPGEMKERRSKVYYLERPWISAPPHVQLSKNSANGTTPQTPQSPYDNMQGQHWLNAGRGPYNRINSFSPSQLTETGNPNNRMYLPRL